MASIGLQRVMNLFMDKELVNVDLENQLVVLGRFYDPAQQPDQDAEEDGSNNNVTENNTFDQSKPISVPEQSMVMVNASDASDDESSEPSHILSDTSHMASELSKLHFRDLGVKLSSNINSFFSPKSAEPIEKDDSVHGWPQPFLEDVKSRIWLTYRVGFPMIPKDKNSPSTVMGALMRGNFADISTDGFTTDCGWGCMIRTSQSLLANALLNLHIGRDWRFGSEIREKSSELIHDKLVSWFADDPVSPFSIHRFVEKGGALCGKSSGEWFGPSAASRSIQALCNEFPEASLKAYLGEDSGEIYEDDLLSSLTEDDKDVPVLILLGLRLGVDNINSLYYSGITDILSIDQSVGIAGGRPSSSHYFFGYQKEHLFFLDPHISNRPALKLVNKYDIPHANEDEDKDTNNRLSLSSPTLLTNADIESVHTTIFNKLHLSEMDPSMLVGILIKNKIDWDKFKHSVSSTNIKKIIHIVEGSKNDSFMGQSRKDSLDLIGGGPLVMVSVDSEMGDDFVDLGAEFENTTSTDLERVSSIDSTPIESNASVKDLRFSTTENSKANSINATWDKLPDQNTSNASFEDLQKDIDIENKREILQKVISQEDTDDEEVNNVIAQEGIKPEDQDSETSDNGSVKQIKVVESESANK